MGSGTKKWEIMGSKVHWKHCVVTIISCYFFTADRLFSASACFKLIISWLSSTWFSKMALCNAMVENDIHVPNGGYSPHLVNSISGNVKILFFFTILAGKNLYVCYNIPVDPPIFGTCGMSKVTMLLKIKYLHLVHLYPGLSKVTMLQFLKRYVVVEVQSQWNISYLSIFICGSSKLQCFWSPIQMKYFILVQFHT